jgi:hypothetical protein
VPTLGVRTEQESKFKLIGIDSFFPLHLPSYKSHASHKTTPASKEIAGDGSASRRVAFDGTPTWEFQSCISTAAAVVSPSLPIWKVQLSLIISARFQTKIFV